ncbi:shikimate 5-dehydrogenase [Acinetobacter sp. MD2(2019)]|uniref:shikimate 5-dehydrogenase n=1 Tax=Acinetobacter sp. MD2(2019) TaxID=2605273 RepID=UPI002D1E9282|nr:shikimate 5-dehydrogenase [Acinetobacter sp. MD2(2019)]MEB3753128.1 shikimate 5-dehydrogenase [Acinetobacter sp. MD2(2019)]
MRLNKDTTLCMSLAAKPSNFGTRFHNYLYDALNLNYVYKAFAPTDLAQAIAGVRGLPVRGCAISMPYKEDVMALVDEMDASATAIQSVNTIVNTNGVLKAYNTDYIAIVKIIEKYNISPDTKFALKGSGGMAKAVAFALKNKGFKNGIIVAKNENAGQALAQSSGYVWQKELQDDTVELLINATPVGMAGTAFEQDLAFSAQDIHAAKIIFDVVALPENTPMIQLANLQGKVTIQGSEVFALQALEQFSLYTGVYPDQAVFQAAAEFSRAG